MKAYVVSILKKEKEKVIKMCVRSFWCWEE